jgi:hypothetical protein
VHRGDEHHESETDGTRESHHHLFLWRVGAGYTWELAERYVVGPFVNLDFIREEARAFVFGITMGVAF